MKRFGKKAFLAVLIAVAALSLFLFAACAQGKTTVTVDFNGGALNGEASATFETDPNADLASLLSDYEQAERKGYTFGGWDIPEKTDGKYGAEVKVTAQWTAVEYSITYDYDGGGLPEGATNPATYTIEQDVTFVAPEKTGWNFKGYVDGSDNPITGITKGSTGDVTVKATWQQIQTTVSFYFPGESEPLETKVLDYGSAIELSAEKTEELSSRGLAVSGLLNKDGTPFTETTASELTEYEVVLDVYTAGMTFEEGDAADYETTAQISYTDGFYTATVAGNGITELYYPNYYNGKPVEVILDSNQVNEGKYFAALTSAYIPANVKLIWNADSNRNYYGLFNGATLLEKVTFADGSKLQEIHDSAMFQNTAALQTVVLPDSVEVITVGLFQSHEGGTAGLTSFTVPKSLKELPADMFGGATELASFVIPEGSQLTKIGSFGGDHAAVTELDFTNATHLTELPSLSGFYNAATYKFPASLQKIGTFAGSTHKNDKVTVIDLSGTQVEELAANTFQNLPNLAEVKFPATLTTIGQRLFGTSGAGNNNTKITELDFSGTQLSAVPSVAFAYMAGLTTVKLPATVKRFGEIAADTAPSLSAPANATVFNESTNVTTVVFGGALEVLGDYAFYNLGRLGDITVEIAAGGKMGSHVFASAGASSSTITVKLGEGAIFADSAFMFANALNLDLQGFTSFGHSGITAPETLDDITALTVTTNARATIAKYPALYGSLAANITFDGALTKLEDYAFALSGATPVFKNAKGVTEYGNYLFYKSKLESFDFTDTPFANVTEKMFYGSSELKELKGWDTLVTVEAGAFVGTKVSSFEIGRRLEYVNPEAFTAGTVTYDVGSNNRYYEKSTNEDGDTEYILYNKDNKVSIFYDVKSAGDEDFERDFTNTELKLTELGNAYAGNAHLTGIKLPETITVISDNAFKGCTALTYAEFKGELTEIGASAFEGCTAFTVFEIPASVTKIGDNAFKGTGLSTLTAKENSLLAQIGANAFDGTKLKVVNLSAATQLESFGAGAFANLAPEPAGEEVFSFTFPQSEKLKTLPDNLFANDLCLTEIEIPAYITSFATGVFSGCTKLTKLSFAEGSVISDFGPGAFAGLNITDLTLPDGVKTIGKAAFAASKLEKITIPAGAVIEAGTSGTDKKNMGAFTGCTALTDVTFKGTDVTVPDYTFYGCSKLVNVNFDKVTTIGQAAFYGTGFTSLTLSGEVSLGKAAFATGKVVTVNLATTVTLTAGSSSSGANIGVFGSCASLQTVTITGEGKLALPAYAFYGSTKLESLSFDKVSSIGDFCFVAGSGTSAKGGLKGAIDLSGVESIGKTAFFNHDKITKLTLSANATIAAGTSANSTSAGGVFGGCTGLTEVTLSGDYSEFEIPAYTFYGCTALQTFDFSKVTKIGESAFQIGSYNEANGFNSDLTLASATEIGKNAFINQTIANLNLPKATSIGESAFSGIKNLGSITFTTDENVTLSLAKGAFNGAAIQTVTLPKNVTFADGSSASTGVFSACTSLTTVTFSGNPVLASYAFAGCSSLRSAVIPAGMEIVPQHAFENCTSLMSIEIPASVNKIDTAAFQGCVKLYVVINKSEMEIAPGQTTNGYVAAYAISVLQSGSADDIFLNSKDGNYSFFNTDGKYYLISYNGEDSSVNLPASVELANGTNVTSYAIADYAFYNNQAIAGITLPATVTGIGSYAFYGTGKLTTVTITDEKDNPSQLASIGLAAFQASGLTAITIPASVTTIADGTKKEEGAFYNSKSLESVTLADGSKLSKIPAYGFYQCTGLKTLSFGTNPSLTEIGKYAFYEDAALDVDLKIPSTVTVVGEDAFFKCAKIKSLTFEKNDKGEYGIATLDKAAFAGCTTIQTVTLPCNIKLTAGTGGGSNATSPGNSNGAFGWCTALSSVTFEPVTGESLTEIPAYAFYSCTALEKINATQTENVVLPDTLTGIGDYALYSTKIASVKIPASVTSIGQNAFRKCASLATVEFVAPADGVKAADLTIGNYAFAEIGITAITLPERLTTLGTYVFNKCASLASVGFGAQSKLESIGNYAFGETAITSITLPASVKTLGTNVFYKCAKLQTADLSAINVTALANNLFEMANATSTELTTVKLPKALEAGGLNANGIFKNCAKLTDIWYEGDAVLTNPGKTSSNRIFYGCVSLNLHVKDTAAYAEVDFANQFDKTGNTVTYVAIETADPGAQA